MNRVQQTLEELRIAKLNREWEAMDKQLNYNEQDIFQHKQHYNNEPIVKRQQQNNQQRQPQLNYVQNNEIPVYQVQGGGNIERSPMSRKKQIKDIEIRNKFLNSLGKLTQTETKHLGMKEIHQQIIDEKGPDQLRIYLAALSESKRPINSVSFEAEVLTLGLLASIYKRDLIDPVDKPPNLFKTCFRLCDMLQKYFKDQSDNVRKACCQSWKEIYKNCLINEDIENKIIIMYDTLAGIINGGADRIAQQTALIVLESFLQLLEKMNDKLLIEIISKKFIPIFLKTKIEHPSLLECMKYFINVLHISYFGQFVQPILDKIISLSQNLKGDVNKLHKTKISSIEVLQLIATQLVSINENLVGCYHDIVIPVLVDLTRDRVLKVQNHAKIALKEWQKLKNVFNNLEQGKLAKSEYFDEANLEQFLEIKTQTHANPVSNIHQPQYQQRKEVMTIYDEPSINQVIALNGGMSNQEKKRNFVKKNSGTGGGNVLINNDWLRVNPTHNKRQNGIKDIIMGKQRNISPNNQFKSAENFYKEKSPYKNQNMIGIPAVNQSENMKSYLQMEQRHQNDFLKDFQPLFNDPQMQQPLGVQGAMSDSVINPKYQQKNIENRNQQVKQQGLEQQVPVHFENAQEFSSQYENFQFQQQQQQNNSNNKHKGDNQQTVQNFNGQKNNNIKQNLNFSKKNEVKFDTNVKQINLADTQFFEDNSDQWAFQNQKESQLEHQFDNQNQYQQNEENQYLSEMSIMWEQILLLYERGDIEQAFIRVLDSGDDIYLIRLLLRTGNIMENLSTFTAQRLLTRFLHIYQTQFLNKLFMDFYQDSASEGLMKNMLLKEQREVKDLLGKIAQEPDIEFALKSKSLIEQLEKQNF